MSSPSAILDRCRRHGLKVWAEGYRIGIAPKQRIPSDLLDEIRAAKSILLPLMREGEALRLTPDQLPWLHVAAQVLAGEFDGGMTASRRQSLVIGLRSIPHHLCIQAFARLSY